MPSECVNPATIGLIVFVSTSICAQEQPLVPWGVHTVVTEGRTTYEGEKLRAVLSYGEIGNPEISIELVHVDMGHPDPSTVKWREVIDLYGEMDDPCPPAETYCGTVEQLRWSSGEFIYSVTGADFVLRCVVSGIRERDLSTRCRAEYPDDVETFIDRREMCDHFRGEEPYDADRARFLAERITETCTGTDEDLAHLKNKYADDRLVWQVLDRFENHIEGRAGIDN